jgi:hypothetical protein
MWILEKRYLLAISTFQDGVPYFPSLHLCDGTIAIFIAVLLFIVQNQIKEGLLTWDVVPKIPWELFYFLVEVCFSKGL